MQTEGAQSAEVGSKFATSTGPRRYTRILLLAIALGLCDQTYWLYSAVDRYQHGYWMPFVNGVGLAPEQYRIGVKLAAWWMVRHLGLGFRHGFALMDLIGTLTAVYLLYGLLERRPRVQAARLELKWFASAAFLALLSFYLAWVGSYFRPETLPTVGLTAVMLWLWSSWERMSSGTLRGVWIVIGLIAASVLQAWIRADVVLALNAGMLLGYLLRKGAAGLQHRSWQILTALLCVGIGAATQLYIMKVKYPQASYGSTPIFMVRHDLKQPLMFPPFLCFMVPIAWTFVQFWRNRFDRMRDKTDVGLVIGSALYMVLWTVFGKLDELRIFIPFALALIPLTVDLALRRISPDAGDVGHGKYLPRRQSIARR